ncbi:MAG: hypothetical protein SCK70_00790 [bacterium]|nr:hypothetical protein [bacterium]
MSKTNHQNKELKFSIYAVLSYIPFLCFLTFAVYDKLDSFTKKHAKQGLILLIIEIISLIFLIDIFSKLFWKLVFIVCLVFAVIGIFKVLLRQSWEIPVFGKYFDKYEI